MLFIAMRIWKILFGLSAYFCVVCVHCAVINIVDSGTEMQYVYYTKQQTWNTARRICLGIGGRLVTINSQSVLDTIKYFVENEWESMGWDHTWIGLYRSSSATDGFSWSDARCSGQTPNGWTAFEGGADSYDSDQLCFRMHKHHYTWKKRECSSTQRVICEKPIATSNCNFADTGTRISYAPMESATANKCQGHCQTTQNCVMAAAADGNYCALAISSTNSSTQLYYKDCPVSGLVDDSDTDLYQGADDQSNTPTPCEPGDNTTDTVSPSLVIPNLNASSAVAENAVTVTTCMSSDVATPSCMPSILTSTVIVTVDLLPPTPVLQVATVLSSSSIFMTSPEPEVGNTFSLCPCLFPTVSTETYHHSSVTIDNNNNNINNNILPTPSTEPKQSSTTTLSNVVCSNFSNTNLSKEELKEVLEEIVRKLEVDTTILSTTIRKKTSAPDPRQSSTSIGYTAAAVMVIPFVVLVLADIPTIVRHIIVIHRK